MDIILIIISAIFLGMHDIIRKVTGKNEKAINVLTISLLIGVILSAVINRDYSVSLSLSLVIIIKSLCILVAWYIAIVTLKYIPISIITPFNAIRPVLMIIMSYFIYNQTITLEQFVGFTILILAYVGFSFEIKKERLNLLKSKYFYLYLLSLVLNVSSGLIDKYLLNDINPSTLQFYFYLYILIGYIIINVYKKSYKEFKLNRNLIYIVLLSFTLFIGDAFYFNAVKITTLNLGIISILKMLSIVVSAIIGGLIFREKNIKNKLIILIFIIIGVGILILNT